MTEAHSKVINETKSKLHLLYTEVTCILSWRACQVKGMFNFRSKRRKSLTIRFDINNHN